MKFSTREDIDAPIDVVFASASNFENFELRALRRGADVARIDDFQQVGVGATWEIGFVFRGRERLTTAQIVAFEPSNGYQVDTKTGGMEAVIVVDLVAMSPTRTRLACSIEMKPKTLSARLLVQSLKLAQNNLSKRYKQAIADFAQSVERTHQGPAKMV